MSYCVHGTKIDDDCVECNKDFENRIDLQKQINSLQRDNEALRRDLQQNKAKAHLANALMVKEQGGGVQIVPAMEAYADTMVEEWKVKLAAAEAKCERLKTALEGMHELCGNYFEETQLICARDKEIWAMMVETLAEPHHERLKEIRSAK